MIQHVCDRCGEISKDPLRKLTLKVYYRGEWINDLNSMCEIDLCLSCVQHLDSFLNQLKKPK